MVALVIVALVIAAVVMALTGVVRGTPNSGSALGTNRPYPSGLLGGSDEPPYLPGAPAVSTDADRREADERRAPRAHDRRRQQR